MVDKEAKGCDRFLHAFRGVIRVLVEMRQAYRSMCQGRNSPRRAFRWCLTSFFCSRAVRTAACISGMAEDSGRPAQGSVG